MDAGCTREDRAMVVKHLHEVRLNEGRIAEALLNDSALRLGMTPRHLRRVVAALAENGRQVPAAPRTRKDLVNDQLTKVAYFKHAGNATKAFADLETRNLTGGMNLRTFQRRVGEFDSWLKACAKGGYREMVKHQLFNIEHIPYRTYAYGMDHTKLPIMVLPERGTTPIFPWLTTVIDLHTRVVLAWVLTPHDPGIEQSASALAEAILGQETDRGFVGGKPEFLRTDRGGDFVSEALTRGLLRLDVERQFTEPYSSWQNGRVERLNGTIDRDFAPSCVGYFPGGEEEYTRRVLKIVVPTASLGTLPDLDRRLSDWFAAYNNRAHRSLGGRTPLDAWFADSQPLQRAEPEIIRRSMMRSTDRRLNKYGIDFNRRVFHSPTLRRLLNEGVQRVEIRYLAHRKHTIEVFHDGEWICTATESSRQSVEQKLGTLSGRKSQREQAAQYIAQANYDRALAERERQRLAGIPDEDLPSLPDEPQADSPESPADEPTHDALIRSASESEIEDVLNNITQESA
ncbi:Mu transposase C-terminal domain-containing protein [Geodermatophilus sp. SYSU D01186]